MKNLRLALPLLLVFAFLQFTTAAPVRKGAVEVELVSEHAQVEAGQPFLVGFHFKLDPTWHIYWKNPGSFGYSLRLNWTLPDGYTAGPIQFPYPHSFTGGGTDGYGYEDEATLLVEITPPDSVKAGDEIRLAVNAGWLACDPQTCVPGSADLTLTLTAADSAGELTAHAEAIRSALSQVPTHKDWGLEATVEGENGTFAITHGGELTSTEGLQFFIENQGITDISVPTEFSLDGDTLKVTRKLKKTELPESLSAVLVLPDHTAYWVTNDEELASAAAAGTASTPTIDSGEAEAGNTGPDIGFFAAMFGAFLAGMVLNIMPCVFPVISLKILGFVEQSGNDASKILRHGLWFTGGVFAFFFILASIIMFAGSALGWGFQLQNPTVVMFLIVILLLVALNFFGVFEIGLSMTGMGSKLADSSGYGGSFWSGALAVVLATPCTAPFMGVAISYALASPPIISYLVFGSLAFGMALPYLFLSSQPALLRKLPRPGAWMETFKQILAFPMLAVTVWLFRVLARQVNLDGLTAFFAALVLVALAAWWYGSFSKPHLKKTTRRVAQVATAALALLIVWLLVGPADQRLESPDRDVEAQIASLQGSGKSVFVDFTAEWCLTCQVNKGAIHSAKVEKAFEEQNVAFVEVDWTQSDPEILKILQKHNREGVPLYLLYNDDPNTPPMILPNVLTPEIILNHLEKIEG